MHNDLPVECSQYRGRLATCEHSNGPAMHSHAQTCTKFPTQKLPTRDLQSTFAQEMLPVFGKDFRLQRPGPGEKAHAIFESISKDHCEFSSRIYLD